MSPANLSVGEKESCQPIFDECLIRKPCKDTITHARRICGVVTKIRTKFYDCQRAIKTDDRNMFENFCSKNVTKKSRLDF